ncbi:MAG: hypothetical protein GY765_14970 [bacterium]|nr:hypothetical protein [bacterium]
MNPPVDGSHWVTANIKWDISQLFGKEGRHRLLLGIYGYNLLNEQVYHPKFVGRKINTIPALSGRGVTVSLTVGIH